MNVFIWQQVEQCSLNYHAEGGVVVFAATEERARALANAVEGCAIRADELPTEVRGVNAGDERVFIFPDAGCC